ncbi:Oxysterol-binding protein-related protein 2A [Raphanus sativus]|nr:Oxysterol-binding protein-related protein 2A [Raphanus sativus]
MPRFCGEGPSHHLMRCFLRQTHSSRLRLDQRHLANGEYEKANLEKQGLERRQRMLRQLQESLCRPRWFKKQGESETFKYRGSIVKHEDNRKWDDCPDILGESS